MANTSEVPVIDPTDYLEDASADPDPPPSRSEVLRQVRLPDSDAEVTLAVMRVDYTVEYFDGTAAPVIHLLCRDEDNQVERVDVYGFQPYFYVESEREAHEANAEHSEIVDIEPGFESIRRNELTRIYTKTPRQVRQLRDEFDSHYEADVLFPNRFLLDLDIYSGITVPEQRDSDGHIRVTPADVTPTEFMVEPRICFFDIEVEDRHGFPEDGDEPILCLTSYDSYVGHYTIWVNTPDGSSVPETLSGYDFIGAEETVEIRAYETETELLDAFLNWIDAMSPSVLSGWNSNDFDLPYLIDRLEVLDEQSSTNLDPDRLSPVGQTYVSGWGPNVKGRNPFDLLFAYKRMQFTEKDSYRLEAIASDELGVGKETFTGDVASLWENDIERLLEYNLRDVELCVELNEENGVIDFWQEARTLVGCQLLDSPTPGSSVDMYILQMVDAVLPSKGMQESEEFEGGAVFDPFSGLEEFVLTLDIKSLYPMAMSTLNLSPETVVSPDDYEGETYEAPNGLHFRKEPDGVLREIIDTLLESREEKKALRDKHSPGTPEYEKFDRQQAAVKVLMNALFGTLGWDPFRLYDKDSAAAVTATGRSVIEFTEEVINEEGYEVIYGDTDSCLLKIDDLDPPEDLAVDDEIVEQFGNCSPEEQRQIQAAINLGYELESKINDRYDDFAESLNAEEHRFEIEFEKLYRRYFQAGKKKRYAGHICFKDGKLVDDVDITGFDSVRSDSAAITKEVMVETLTKIVRGDPLTDIRSYLYDQVQRVRTGEGHFDEVAIPGGINQHFSEYDSDTAQVRGAKFANTVLGTNFGKGSKPKRLYLKKVGADFFVRFEEKNDILPQDDDVYRAFKQDPDVICYEFPENIPEEFVVDWDEMLRKTVKRPISRILQPLDLSWEEIMHNDTQTGIEQFM